MNLSEVAEKARAILKSLKDSKAGDDKKTSPMPEPPPDPDGLDKDPRVGDASPDEGDLEEAGKAATPPPAQESEGGGEDLDQEEAKDQEDEEDEKRPVAKGFTEEEMELIDADPREFLKSFGDDTLLPPPEKVKGAGDDLSGILNDILDKLKDDGAVMAELQAEVKRLRTGLDKNERTINKALESLGDPRFAPAPPPKAITKAFPEPPAQDRSALADAIYAKAKAGHMTVDQAVAACRTGRIDG